VQHANAMGGEELLGFNTKISTLGCYIDTEEKSSFLVSTQQNQDQVV
jgi:hypothetical protein